MKGVAAALLVAAPIIAAQERPIFRSDTRAVFVSVSVKKGNNPVPGLKATDFVLMDSGVHQRVDDVEMEAVPIDVSLFIDTSGSTAVALDEMKDAVQAIAAMLRPGDRFRLLTIGLSVYQAVDWTEAGHPIESLDVFPVSGISLVYDAIYAAAAHVVEPGRRHLVVAMTDGMDECSLVRPPQLRDLVGRTEAVVHWVPMAGMSGGRTGRAAFPCSKYSSPADPSALGAVVKGTGGTVHDGFLGGIGNGDPVKAFRKVLDDYRQSYVLRYTPDGAPKAGWHELKVTVPSGKYTIDARAGYFGE